MIAEQAKGKKTKKAKGPAPRQLRKLLRAAESSEDGDRAWLETTREILRGGKIKSDDEYLLATRILLRSDEPHDLLMAHVSAVAALFFDRKASKARRLAAHSLDRFLLATGAAQRFGTVLDDEGEPVAPHDSSFGDLIRREFGVGKAGKKR